jgi:threonine dehydrogenase-like Zn-dependent dehydrogenase
MIKPLCFVSKGVLGWREAPEPLISNALQAIVRPIVVGRWDLDVAIVQGMIPLPAGEPIGHEIISEIVDLGDRVSGFSIGETVIVPAQISCGECRSCLRGFTGRCESVPLGALYGMGRVGEFGGGAADLVMVPFATATLFKLPIGADPVDWIGFTDMAQDAYRAVGPALLQRPKSRVLVIGGFPEVIGIYSAAMAKALGASEVDYYDNDSRRLKEVQKYAVHPLNSDIQEPHDRYAIVVDSSIDSKALMTAFKFADPEAIVTSVSIHIDLITPIPLVKMYRKGVFYRIGRPNCRQYMQTVADLCCSGKFKPHNISSKVFSFEEAESAWADKAMRILISRPSLHN